MITENLPTLKINKLSKAQYERELAAGNLDPYALYLTEDEGTEFPVESVNGKTGAVELTADDVGAVKKTGDTMTGTLTVSTWMGIKSKHSSENTSLKLMDNDDNLMTRLYTNPSHHRLVVEQQATDTTFTESYWFPTVSQGLTENMGYRILTNKGMVDHKGEALIVNSSGNDIDYKVLGGAAVKDWTNTITQDSTHLVTSGAVYTGLAGKLNLSGGTLTGPLTAPNFFVKKDGYVEFLKLFDASGGVRCYSYINDSNQVTIRYTKSGANGNVHEVYSLPAPDNKITSTGWYSFLTTKNTVTVAQGGTGAANVLQAAKNLGVMTVHNPYTDEFQIPQNGDLDDYTTGGVYRSASAAITESLDNVPDNLNVAFRLEVKNIATNKGVIQTIIANSTYLRIYCRVSDGATGIFGAWKKLNFEATGGGGSSA